VPARSEPQPEPKPEPKPEGPPQPTSEQVIDALLHEISRDDDFLDI